MPNITSGEGGIGDWSEADIANYLETGFTPDFDSVGGAMVDVQRNMAQLTPEDLKKYADATGLSSMAFESCVTSNKFAAAVQADIDEGVRAGVTGTPAFFINGRLIAGAQPLERFVAMIEEEMVPSH